MRKPILEFWFEFASSYSYLAAEQVEARAAAAGVRVAWRPFLLGRIFRAHPAAFGAVSCAGAIVGHRERLLTRRCSLREPGLDWPGSLFAYCDGPPPPPEA